MSDNAYIEELRREVERLLKLLQDPQPGLSTWNKFYEEAMTRVAVFCMRPPVGPATKAELDGMEVTLWRDGEDGRLIVAIDTHGLTDKDTYPGGVPRLRLMINDWSGSVAVNGDIADDDGEPAQAVPPKPKKRKFRITEEVVYEVEIPEGELEDTVVCAAEHASKAEAWWCELDGRDRDKNMLEVGDRTVEEIT